jgi:hypothetical protein
MPYKKAWIDITIAMVTFYKTHMGHYYDNAKKNKRKAD